MLRQLVVLYRAHTREVWGYLRIIEKQEVPWAVPVSVFMSKLTAGRVIIQNMNPAKTEDRRLGKLNSGYASILAQTHLSMSVGSEHIAERICAALAASRGDEKIVLAHTIGMLKAEFGERRSAIQEERSKAVLSGLLQTIPASLSWNW